MEFEEYLKLIDDANAEKVASMTDIADKKAAAMLAIAVNAQEEMLSVVKMATDKIDAFNQKRAEFETSKQDAYDKELLASLEEVDVEAEIAKSKKSK